jgi:hypothetical protein
MAADSEPVPGAGLTPGQRPSFGLKNFSLLAEGGKNVSVLQTGGEQVQSWGVDRRGAAKGQARKNRQGHAIWAYLLMGLAMVLGGCQAKEVPLSTEAQVLKKDLLGELGKLTAAVLTPAARQDWQAVNSIVQTFYEEMVKAGKGLPFRIGVLDREGVARGGFPPVKEQGLDFSGYATTRTVFTEKKKAQTVLHLGDKKLFVVMSPLLDKDQVKGAAALVFTEEELQKTWKVPEKEFLRIDFNK